MLRLSGRRERRRVALCEQAGTRLCHCASCGPRPPPLLRGHHTRPSKSLQNYPAEPEH